MRFVRTRSLGAGRRAVGRAKTAVGPVELEAKTAQVAAYSLTPAIPDALLSPMVRLDQFSDGAFPHHQYLTLSAVAAAPMFLILLILTIFQHTSGMIMTI